ncbi:MAG: uroporphyrinogen decarboxylase family protein [Candidatus Latescibacteria bacterium]|nr:uroporphyrinogen decarboxylase family protein [Candidatus Latescibacterota bacterium]
MDTRERFLRQMRFERVDRPLRWETLGFWGETITRWRKEGLSEDVLAHDYFEMEKWAYLPVNSGFTMLPLDPTFEHKELERDDKYVVYQDRYGIVRRQSATHPERSMPQWLKFPIETPADFETMRKNQLDPDVSTRYPDWAEMHEDYYDRDYPLGMTVCGAYGTPRNCFGEERLAYVYYDDPDLIHEIMRWWLDFYTRLITRVTDNFEGLDFILLWEDMAHKTGPLISPDFVKRFMMPYYEPLNDHIKSCGIPVIWLDTDGNADSLLDMFVGSGVDAICPFEIAAGMEPQNARKRFGNKLALLGGVDKRAVAEGGDAMKKEVMRKVPALLESGGYVPGIDHATPPDTSFDDHRAFVDLVRELGQKYGG